jgi:hypothetical protein
MTEHKIGLMMVENRAFIERIAWYTVGIVNLLVDVDYQNKDDGGWSWDRNRLHVERS